MGSVSKTAVGTENSETERIAAPAHVDEIHRLHVNGGRTRIANTVLKNIPNFGMHSCTLAPVLCATSRKRR